MRETNVVALSPLPIALWDSPTYMSEANEVARPPNTLEAVGSLTPDVRSHLRLPAPGPGPGCQMPTF